MAGGCQVRGQAQQYRCLFSDDGRGTEQVSATGGRCSSTYDTALYKLTEKAGIEHISMHTLRHTFATRCIEAGMRPKTLQGILGHANIGITMNLYVYNTEEENPNAPNTDK